MASWDDVRRIALALPETGERLSRELRQWRVRDKLFVWERPLRRADLEALGDEASDGPILGARVEHLGAQEALLADASRLYFTTPHFDGYAAILVRIDPADTEAAVARPGAARMEMGGRTMDGWVTVAPGELKTKRRLAAWVKRSVAFVNTLPPK